MAPVYFYLLLAVALLGTELLVMQFSVLWFLLFGLGALVAAVVCWFSPQLGYAAATGIFVLASLGLSALLYRPLVRNLRSMPAPGNDAIGQSVTVLAAITPDRPGKVSWSGSDWQAELAAGETALQAGDSAVIRRLEGIRLIVGRA